MQTILDTFITVDSQAESQKLHFVFKAKDFSISAVDGFSAADLAVYKVVDGKETPYTITTQTWSGRKLEAYDALDYSINAFLSDNKTYSFSYVHESIIAFKNQNCHVATNLNGHNVYREFWRVNLNWIEKYTLLFVTNQFAYYEQLDNPDPIMLDSNDGRVVADGYFAEIGLRESMENISVDNNADGEKFVMHGLRSDEEWDKYYHAYVPKHGKKERGEAR